MSIKSSISGGIIYVEISETLKIADCLQHVKFLLNLKDKIKNRYELIDHTNTKNIDLSGEDFQTIFKYALPIKDIFEHSYVAIYCNHDLNFGLSRMFESYHQLSQHSSIVDIFIKKEKAIEFLANAMERHD